MLELLQLEEIRGPLAAGAVLALLMAVLGPAKADDAPALTPQRAVADRVVAKLTP
jgi:hypothetical protein